MSRQKSYKQLKNYLQQLLTCPLCGALTMSCLFKPSHVKMILMLTQFKGTHHVWASTLKLDEFFVLCQKWKTNLNHSLI